MKLIDSSDIGKYLNRLEEDENELVTEVSDIIKEIRQGGDVALKKFCNKFDNSDYVILPNDLLKKAYDEISDDLKASLEKSKNAIYDYHKHQIENDYEIKKDDVSKIKLVNRPLERVLVYVPGGTAAYPSTVLMNTIPAKIAGVKEIIMTSPPVKNEKYGIKKSVLAAAYIAGIDKVYNMGGAHAVAAFAYGTENINPVDKIVGPGNKYVATAKKLVFGKVDIDSIAGPSEILIIADENANHEFIAFDLMSQAEHDIHAIPMLLTTSVPLVKKVCDEIDEKVEKLERKDIIKKSIDNNGLIVLCKNKEEIVKIANEIAPEHLEILCDDADEIAEQIKNAASVFIGQWTPEALGDYMAGVNHVLPTGGTARFASPLGVYSFIKKMSITKASKKWLYSVSDDIKNIAEEEGLTAHKMSVEIRKGY